MLDRQTREPVRKIATKVLVSRGLVSAFGTTGHVGVKVRRNMLLKALLNRKLSSHQIPLANLDINGIRQKTLAFVEAMRLKRNPYGQHRYSPFGATPVLYASTYACLIRHLCRDLEALSDSDRKGWIEYIQRHQSNDGLFRDPLVENQLADTVDWWGWRHLSLHVIMALAALGETPRNRFSFLENFRDYTSIPGWLRSRRWQDDPSNVSNEIQNHGALLQYARDFQGEQWADGAIKKLLDELDKMQDPNTGLWGGRFDTPALLSNGVQTAYHILLLYFYDRRRMNLRERIIDCCLATQNELGGFGPFLNSSACEDIDSIDPLARFYSTSDRKSEIESAAKLAMRWTFANMNVDGGFVFRRYEPFIYGHENMFSSINESSMFPTWFRTLSLAYMGKLLPSSPFGFFDWQFLDCPGYQFWRV